MTMTMTIPKDCGNSPRMALVAEIVRAWAAQEDDAVREWLHEDAQWELVGAAGGAAVQGIVPPPFAPERGEILTVLNHGRLAACDGYLIQEGQRVDFCHVLRFAGTTKTAKIKEIRTYLQPAS